MVLIAIAAVAAIQATPALVVSFGVSAEFHVVVGFGVVRYRMP